MESFGRMKLIKTGFWLGVGFTLPVIIATLAGSALTLVIPSFWSVPSMEMAESFMEDLDKSGSVRIDGYREVAHGKQLLVIGSIENTGNSPLGSVQLEAELFNQKKEMVFECSEYVSKKLKPGEKENFQINCGCGQETVPNHASMTVRVVKASTY